MSRSLVTCAHCQSRVDDHGVTDPETSHCCSCLRNHCPCGTTRQWIVVPTVRVETSTACGCTCGQYYNHDNGKFQCNGCGCFPSTASVSLENGKSIKMSELKIGDQVQTGIYVNL